MTLGIAEVKNLLLAAGAGAAVAGLALPTSEVIVWLGFFVVLGVNLISKGIPPLT